MARRSGGGRQRAGFCCRGAFIASGGHYVAGRIARNRPYTTNAIKYGYRASQLCAVLFALRLVLTGAPENMPLLLPLSRIEQRAADHQPELAGDRLRQLDQKRGRHPQSGGAADNLRARRC